MSSQTNDLHRALLRPMVIHTLRAAGFHSTKPSVLDTLVNLAERYLLLLASTTANQALSSHNDAIPTIADVRVAMQECGALIPLESSAEENWSEVLRRPAEDLSRGVQRGGRQRVQAEKRKREEEDVADIGAFLRWFDGGQNAEIKRVAGMVPEGTTAGTGVSGAGGTAAVGVGGSVVQMEDFLTKLKKKQNRGGADEGARLQGTVLGRQAEDRGVVIEGGPVQKLSDWPARVREMAGSGQAQGNESEAAA